MFCLCVVVVRGGGGWMQLSAAGCCVYYICVGGWGGCVGIRGWGRWVEIGYEMYIFLCSMYMVSLLEFYQIIIRNYYITLFYQLYCSPISITYVNMFITYIVFHLVLINYYSHIII